MEDTNTALALDSDFATDVVGIYKLYEQALRVVDYDRLPPKIARVLRNKIKVNNSTFRESSADYLHKSLEQLDLTLSKASQASLALSKSIFEAIDRFKTPAELISIVVGIEENLDITLSLLRMWSLENLKKRNSYHQYRNSNLKLFFSLNQNLPVLEEIIEFETDAGITDSNEAATELTTLFFEWWKTYYSPEKIEEYLG